MPAMIASLRVLSSTLWSWVRRDSTDLLNCSFAVWSLPFSLRSFVSSCVWERAVKYWTEKKVDRQSDEASRSEEHTSELQSPDHLVCRLLLEKKKTISCYM